MKIRFLGDPSVKLDIIPRGTEFSIPLKKLLSKSLLFKLEYNSNECQLPTIFFIVVGPETVEDVEYLENLRREVLSHKYILLGNCDTDVYLEKGSAGEVGRWLFEGQIWSSWSSRQSIWHYIVSEIVKDEGVPYYEIIGYLNSSKRISGYKLLSYADNKIETLCDSPNLARCVNMAYNLMNEEENS